MIGLVQDWPKWLFRWNCFSFRSAWIFACAFQFGSKTFPCIFSAEMLLFRFIAFIVHASIFCPRFSRKQSANQQKKYRRMFYYLIEKHMQIFRHFWRKRNYPKQSFTPVLHQAIQLHVFPSWVPWKWGFWLVSWYVLFFSCKQKINCTAWFTVLSLVNMESFIRICSKLIRILNPKTCQFLQRNVCQGFVLPFFKCHK